MYRAHYGAHEDENWTCLEPMKAQEIEAHEVNETERRQLSE